MHPLRAGRRASPERKRRLVCFMFVFMMFVPSLSWQSIVLDEKMAPPKKRGVSHLLAALGCAADAFVLEHQPPVALRCLPAVRAPVREGACTRFVSIKTPSSPPTQACLGKVLHDFPVEPNESVVLDRLPDSMMALWKSGNDSDMTRCDDTDAPPCTAIQ